MKSLRVDIRFNEEFLIYERYSGQCVSKIRWEVFELWFGALRNIETRDVVEICVQGMVRSPRGSTNDYMVAWEEMLTGSSSAL